MPAIDTFDDSRAGLGSPATKAFGITPDDDAELTVVTRGIYVGGAGDLAVVMADAEMELVDEELVPIPVTIVGVLAGVVYPLRVRQVLEATTATNLVGLA